VSVIEMMDTIDDADRKRRVRRTWSQAEKDRIVAQSYAPGASVSEVARRYDVNANLVFTWRRQARSGESEGDGSAPALVPIRVIPETAEPAASIDSCEAERRPSCWQPVGMMEIDLGHGRCIRVDRDVDGTALRRVLLALERR